MAEGQRVRSEKPTSGLGKGYASLLCDGISMRSDMVILRLTC